MDSAGVEPASEPYTNNEDYTLFIQFPFYTRYHHLLFQEARNLDKLVL